MVRTGLDVVEDVGVEVLPGLPLVMSPLDDVKQMRNHAGRDERLTAIVEVDAPRVARAVGEHLEHVSRGMIAPDAGVDRGDVGFQCL